MSSKQKDLEEQISRRLSKTPQQAERQASNIGNLLREFRGGQFVAAESDRASLPAVESQESPTQSLNDQGSLNDQESLSDSRLLNDSESNPSPTRSVESSLPGQSDQESLNNPRSFNDQASQVGSLLDSLPSSSGYFSSFNVIEDILMPQLDSSEQLIYRRLIRLSWGYGRETCTVGWPKIEEKTRIKRSAAKLAAKRLVAKGLIQKLGIQFDPTEGEQGTTWKVTAPSFVRKQWEKRRPRSFNDQESVNDSESLNSPIIKHDVFVSKNTRTQTQSGVSVGSRFSLEECRRYANHLKASGQGITNPGGYATKIFRSGEADALVDAFLSPPAPVDITQCPDCRGMGMYYPNGIGNGPVVKCRHEKLTA